MREDTGLDDTCDDLDRQFHWCERSHVKGKDMLETRMKERTCRQKSKAG